MATLTVLNRELYDINLAANVLKMSPTTLKRWLEGGKRHGKWYPPIIRDEPTGSAIVTWGELVEARYLLGYRRDLQVGLPALRKWVSLVREELDVPYPLAHQQPWVGPGRRLLWDAQNSAELPADLWAMWEATSGQVLLTAPAESFLERVKFEHDEAVRIFPVGTDSPIVIDPEVRFGMATIRGIPTEAIIDQIQGGDPVEVVADDFDLDITEIAQVISYEKPRFLTAA